MKETITVAGAGLSGCEAAWQLAGRGLDVTLIEMKPGKKTPAHVSADFGELVCSNSLRAIGLENAVGLLKEELRRLDSLIIQAADAARVEAGGALAVDRAGFSDFITRQIRSHPRITVIEKELTALPDSAAIIATGPLTSELMARAIGQLFPQKAFLHFYDAAAPIVSRESIDMERAFFASRYDKGPAAYINCPMNRAEYEAFHDALVNARQAEVHGFEDRAVFEGCMPVEVMARRGLDTLRFGPMKPVGLLDPKTGKEAYAVCQLRRDNSVGTLYNMVGFQTHLAFPEQKRVFSMIPALQNAEFLRYGVMHRNTYLDAPRLLDRYYRLRARPALRFAGQITGVEGYVESAASGLLAGLEAAAEYLGYAPVDFPKRTAIGALALYVSDQSVKDFQPMNINFGLIEPLEEKVRGKRSRREAISARSLETLEALRDRIPPMLR